jgi:hypothetical protein
MLENFQHIQSELEQIKATQSKKPIEEIILVQAEQIFLANIEGSSVYYVMNALLEIETCCDKSQKSKLNVLFGQFQLFQGKQPVQEQLLKNLLVEDCKAEQSKLEAFQKEFMGMLSSRPKITLDRLREAKEEIKAEEMKCYKLGVNIYKELSEKLVNRKEEWAKQLLKSSEELRKQIENHIASLHSDFEEMSFKQQFLDCQKSWNAEKKSLDSSMPLLELRHFIASKLGIFQEMQARLPRSSKKEWVNSLSARRNKKRRALVSPSYQLSEISCILAASKRPKIDDHKLPCID